MKCALCGKPIIRHESVLGDYWMHQATGLVWCTATSANKATPTLTRKHVKETKR